MGEVELGRRSGSGHGLVFTPRAEKQRGRIASTRQEGLRARDQMVALLPSLLTGPHSPGHRGRNVLRSREGPGTERPGLARDTKEVARGPENRFLWWLLDPHSEVPTVSQPVWMVQLVSCGTRHVWPRGALWAAMKS